ncbi:MAG: iron-sulfur cluster assembly protein [Rhodospirillales bacterium]
MSALPSKDMLLLALKAKVMDPELGVNIVDLDCKHDGIELDLIMTTPTCPQGHGLTDEARRVLESAAPGQTVTARLLPQPFWSPARMSDEARRQLGWKTSS